MTPRDAYFLPQEVVEASDAVGRVSGAAVATYPPGIPLLHPGQRIGQGSIDALVAARTAGATVTGLAEAGTSSRLLFKVVKEA